jgi:hypothetical protein
MNHGPNQYLAQNLDRLLALKGLGRKEAAEAIGVPYKWLRKAVSQGLARPDQRNSDRLQRITEFVVVPIDRRHDCPQTDQSDHH